MWFNKKSYRFNNGSFLLIQMNFILFYRVQDKVYSFKNILQVVTG